MSDTHLPIPAYDDIGGSWLDCSNPACAAFSADTYAEFDEHVRLMNIHSADKKVEE